MQCGVASLAMICQWYGRSYSVAKLEQYCHPTNEGVSLKGIADAAAELGFKAHASKMDTETLKKAPLPLILHWNRNHFVVLYGISKNGKRFYVADPAKGKVKYKEEEFKEHWIYGDLEKEGRGIAMYLEPDDATVRSPQKKIENITGIRRRSISFLLGYLKKYRKEFVKVFLTLLIGCLLQPVLPFLTQSIVDKGIHHGDIGFIWLILLGELLIVTGYTVTDFFRRWLLLHISMRVNISLISNFFIKLLRLPMSFFDTKLLGDLLQRIGDHGRVQDFLSGQFLNVVFTLVTLLVFGIILAVYNLTIFLVFLGGSICYGGWITLFLRRRRILDYELFERQARNQNRTYQFVTAMQEIKLQDCEQRRRQEWEDTQTDLFEVRMKNLKLQQTQEAGAIFINEVKNILITVLAATAVINGEMTLGAMLAVQYIIGQLNSPVEQLMGFVYTLQDVGLSLERIDEIHNGREEEHDEGFAVDFRTEKRIELRNISFRYDQHALQDTINGITLDIPAGKTLAIVGASGSGKTTLLKLILGYYPVLSGEIVVAGRPIEEYSLKWWRRHCGVVMQEGVIFSESIARNIAVGDGDIDIDRVREAARIACIDRYVETLPLGYDTMVGRDGVGLSQGQKQRILIARAVYKNPDFIFLDEATNALDAKNEREIVRNLKEFYKERTVMVIAHRLSTVRDADRIIVLDNGKITESGTHSELIELRGTYYKLVRNQLELGN